MIAGLAGAPVDMTNEVLKLFGLGSEKPFGGSESIGSGMESMGMVSPERHIIGELGAGLVDPFSTVATGAKLAHGMTALMPLMTVYHGTPHKFEAFDASKIGTGEGAQAYGHGLYVAENPEVAKGYQDSTTVKFKGSQASELPEQAWDELGTVMQKHNIPGDMVAGVDEPKMVRMMLNKYAEQLNPSEKQIFEKYASAPEGNLYKVDLPDEHIEKMLDWDKPLSEQPHIMGLKNPNGEGTMADYFKHRQESPEDIAGADLMFQLGHRDSPKRSAEISDWFNQQGVPGVKYLDSTSRGTGKEGPRNFVIFPGNEDKLKILSRNGVPVNP
jgi:hypothetical protein